MKKNVMMRVASVMLVLVLLTSSVISGTFAKYVTSETGTDSARVAKFGVTITANGNMFAKGYKEADTVSIETEAGASVWAIDGKDVVAPGTSGTMATMTLEGQPEVDVWVTYDATVTINDKWVAGDPEVNYFPLVIKVDGVPVAYDPDDAPADIAAAIEAAIEAHVNKYEANTVLSGVGGDAVKVTWEWPYSTGDANDKLDTDLGDAAAEIPANAGTIEISIKTTVTQVD